MKKKIQAPPVTEASQMGRLTYQPNRSAMSLNTMIEVLTGPRKNMLMVPSETFRKARLMPKAMVARIMNMMKELWKFFSSAFLNLKPI